MRIEARRQLEATLDDERKVQMTEAKRLIDEAVEEEKKFLMKKLENALEDEKKLSDKKLEAALEQVSLANRIFFKNTLTFLRIQCILGESCPPPEVGDRIRRARNAPKEARRRS